MTGFLGHLVPGSFESLGKIITPWLRIMLVALGVGAAVGPLPAAADGGRLHRTARRPRERTGRRRPSRPGADSDGDRLQPAYERAARTWMGDIDPCISNRRLTDIVIPGSHDSITYSFGPGLAQTQTVDLDDQLNNGARVFDIRVEYLGCYDDGCTGCRLLRAPRFSRPRRSDFSMTSSLNWRSGHASATGKRSSCSASRSTKTASDIPDRRLPLSSPRWDNLVTPGMLLNAFKTTDPGELTFGQLWSLPKKPGIANVARVIMDNPQCLEPTRWARTQWGPISPR